MDFVKREHLFDDETYKAYLESIQKQQQTVTFHHAATINLQQALHGSLVAVQTPSRVPPLHRQMRHYEMKHDTVVDERDIGLNDLELQTLSHQGLLQTIPEQDLTRIASDLSQRLRGSTEAPALSHAPDPSHREGHGADRGHVLPASKTPYIKLEQNDEYYYIAPQDGYGGVNGIGGLVATDPRETATLLPYPPAPLHPYRAHNYQSDAQNLVVHKLDQFVAQDGGGGERRQNGGATPAKAEEPKENLKPADNHYYDYAIQSDAKSEKDAAETAIKAEYGCHKCTLVFTTKRGLKQHAKVCLDAEKTQGKVLCPQCPYTCHSSAILKIHQRTHTGEKPFSCSFCDYKSGQKNNVAKHMMLHMREKPFRCQYCEYRCAQKNNLVVHERTHTGDKPFACTYCEYRTVQKANLVKHMYLHTDQKPYSCDLCSYRCVQKTNLTKHRLRHAKDAIGAGDSVSVSVGVRERPLKCERCAYSCVQKASLARHMAARHPDTVSVEPGKDYEFVMEGEYSET